MPSGTWVLGRHSGTWKVLSTRALRRHLRHLGTRTLRALRHLGIYAQVTRVVKTLGHSETWTLEAIFSRLAECVSISAFDSILGAPIVFNSCAVELKIFEITAAIKKYKLIVRKNKEEA